ncbi:nucleoside-diphosphate kinase [Leuconostoc gelidum subsp. aenigmaticum]|jgi:nucleoside-diphosphate kinase|uniref:Nucleoside diphosphate kinase n=1 Tax=Leuconostoc gelidum subsp. gelidum TaxID=1607839 RepID=A0ABS7V281_LEUGE|nr:MULTISPECIES: nucleoside-diphosphate kinase [Leuconostoc]MBR2277277.1 nucleoside-diphosphate kinase [Leuconostoc sp.]AFS40019.1 nucleoside diphosphate kinase [Leuconostoc gelidum JB7]MBZ5964471.1 nucleoside-diphosphate kinase [Leuconostoc gelidum subsp. gelidum]MBZ5977106.1 nucleoside-diphosphate kinase [Leuconostoc gelidum subsp. gelidum]MBZ5977933.1 nucleoside-diphosphate kinase [Leuconostoc gelidum subsp. gelidum]
MTERTLMLIKPDGVKRGKIGEIIRRIENKGYQIIAMKMVVPTEKLLNLHYAEHVGKSYYPSLVSYMMSGPVVVMIGEGTNIISGWRTLMGETNPTKAAPGTIRGDLGREWEEKAMMNIVHGSDSVLSAEREINLWFT